MQEVHLEHGTQVQVQQVQPGIMSRTGVEVWAAKFEAWQARGMLDLPYRYRPTVAPLKRPRRRLTDAQMAKLPPRVSSGGELVKLGGACWQDRTLIAKGVEMWGRGMCAGAIRQVQCSRIAWVVLCEKESKLWHRTFRCRLRFCPSCMAAVYEGLFQEVHGRLVSVAARLVPEWPVQGHRPLRVIAKLDFTIRNTGEMSGREQVRWFNRCIRKFFIRLAKQNGWARGEWGAAWCAEFGPGNTNLHAHAVFCGPWIEQKGRQASALWSAVVGEFAILSVKAARSFHHALRHAIKYPAASWKYFQASSERLADLEHAFYTVRRLHTVGAFYAPMRGVAKVVEFRDLFLRGLCPDCGHGLVELPDPGWRTLHEVMRMGSLDLGARERADRLLEREPPKPSLEDSS